jgi:hypothetical protein
MVLAPTVPCPKCRLPIPGELIRGGSLSCNHCGHSFKPALSFQKPDPVGVLKFIRLPSAGDLDGQTEMVAAQLAKAGLPATYDPAYNQSFRFNRFARVIHVAWSPKAYDLVLVTTMPWTPQGTQDVLGDFMSMANRADREGHAVRFRIASAAPLPGVLDYLFGAFPRGEFERRARIEASVADPTQAIAVARATELSNKAVRLVKELFSKRIDLTNLGEVGTLDALVLDELRRGTQRTRPLPPAAFVPHASLLLLGCCFGEILRQSGRVKAAWKSHPQAPFGLGMSIGVPSGKALVINPIGKIVKTYEQGEKEAMRDLAQTLQHGKRR